MVETLARHSDYYIHSTMCVVIVTCTFSANTNTSLINTNKSKYTNTNIDLHTDVCLVVMMHIFVKYVYFLFVHVYWESCFWKSSIQCDNMMLFSDYWEKKGFLHTMLWNYLCLALPIWLFFSILLLLLLLFSICFLLLLDQIPFLCWPFVCCLIFSSCRRARILSGDNKRAGNKVGVSV